MMALTNFDVRSGESGFGFLAVLFALVAGAPGATGPNIKALLMNVNPSSRRGTVFGVYTLCDNLGKGIGPSLVCVLIAMFGRRAAFSLAFCLWWACSFICIQVRGTVDRDVMLCER